MPAISQRLAVLRNTTSDLICRSTTASPRELRGLLWTKIPLLTTRKWPTSAVKSEPCHSSPGNGSGLRRPAAKAAAVPAEGGRPLEPFHWGLRPTEALPFMRGNSRTDLP
jgi:hypothetical protein